MQDEHTPDEAQRKMRNEDEDVEAHVKFERNDEEGEDDEVEAHRFTRLEGPGAKMDPDAKM